MVSKSLCQNIQITLLVLVAIQFAYYGFYCERLILTNQSLPKTDPHPEAKQRKIILMCLDALREDFVDFDEQTAKHKRLSNDREHSYHGDKLSIFKELREQQPENSLFWTVTSVMPTLTTVRSRAMLTGALNSIYEMTDDFRQPHEMLEDSIINQVHKQSEENKVHCFGDLLWDTFYNNDFDKLVVQPDVRGFYEQREDEIMAEVLWKDLEEGISPKMTIFHIIGLDGYGHNSGHPNTDYIKSGVKHYDDMFRKLITMIDDDTTILAFGDHGMDDKGDHGGDSDLEMRTVMFAYQKTPFPMLQFYQDNIEKFYSIDHSLKTLDVAAMTSLVLDTQFPFANMGVFHPALAPYEDLNYAHKKMTENLEYMQIYISTYCQINYRYWCHLQKEFQAKFEVLRDTKVNTDEQILDILIKMHELAREEMTTFSDFFITSVNEQFLWTAYFVGAYVSILIGFIAVLRFHTELDEDNYSTLPMKIFTCFFLAQLICFSLQLNVIATVLVIAMLLISVYDNLGNFYMCKQHFQYDLLCNFEPIHYVVISVYIVWRLTQNSRALLERASVWPEMNITMIFSILWFLQPLKTKQNDWKPWAAFVLLYQMASFCDTQNFHPKVFADLKSFLTEGYFTVQLLALIVFTYTESRFLEEMCQTKFGKLEKYVQGIMTASVVVYFSSQAMNKDQGVALLRSVTLLLALGCSALILTRNKFKDCSPLLGLVAIKAGMVLSNAQNPIIFTLLLVQLYSLAIIHKQNLQDTNTRFTIKILVYVALYLTMQQFFYRRGRFEKFKFFQFKKTCGWDCPFVIGVPIQLFELSVQNLAILLLMPIIVNQQVQSKEQMKPVKQIEEDFENFEDEIVQIKQSNDQTSNVAVPQFKHQGFDIQMIKAMTILMLFQVQIVHFTTNMIHRVLYEVFLERYIIKFFYDVVLTCLTLVFAILWSYLK